MRNSWLVGVLAVTACVLCRSAVADELFKYNYVEPMYMKGTATQQGFSGTMDSSMYGVFGRYAVHELVAIGANYGKSKSSTNGSFYGTAVSATVSGSSWGMSVIVHKMVSDNTEVGLNLGRSYGSSDAFTETVGGTTYSVPASTYNLNYYRIGVRTALASAFRLQAWADRSFGGNSSGDTSYDIGAEYLLSKDFSLGADYLWGTGSVINSHYLSVSGRYYY